MKNAINWFEISTTDLDRTQVFYEAVRGRTLRREVMGPSSLAVFPYDPTGGGAGGALLCDPSAAKPGSGGTLVYLDGNRVGLHALA